MRNICCSAIDYADLDDVRAEHPAAAEIIEVDGGWKVFFPPRSMPTYPTYGADRSEHAS